ncbi:P-loop containing nucleoside triphosphate hydrolase protein [Zopfochytrium polystomum]|nr:P-loop containing nucleoside triphosphate hydrolase protein [Zopfochytrium polystomum]
MSDDDDGGEDDFVSAASEIASGATTPEPAKRRRTNPPRTATTTTATSTRQQQGQRRRRQQQQQQRRRRLVRDEASDREDDDDDDDDDDDEDDRGRSVASSARVANDHDDRDDDDDENDSEVEFNPKSLRRPGSSTSTASPVTGVDPDATPRPAKRVRAGDHPAAAAGGGGLYSLYPVGAIVKIRLTNFVTYNYVEVSPGPYLNMVLGPNGTGKSTIVCAIALGLGGKPEILGRAKEVKEFVKKGQSKAVIEIVLKTETGVLTVQRAFKDGSNTSTWKLNGENSTEKHVKQAIGLLNIQVDNLCQFLPQDKVSEFAQMTPAQLLLETQRAVGKPELIQYHNQLVEKQTELKSIQSTLAGEEAQLASLTQKVEELETQVEKMKEREKQLRLVSLLDAAIAWSEYEAARAEFQTVKAEKLESEKAKNTCTARLRPLEEKRDQLNQQRRAADAKSFALKKSQDDHVKKISKINGSLEEEDNRAKQIGMDIAAAKQEISKKQNEIARSLEKKAAVQLEIQQTKEKLIAEGILNPDGTDAATSSQFSSEQQGQLQEIQRQMRENAMQLQSLAQEVERIQQSLRDSVEERRNYDRQLQRLNSDYTNATSFANRKLEALRRSNDHAAKVVDWLRKHPDHPFDKKVFEPICLHINPRRPELAPAIELAIGNSITTFVTQTRDDYMKLGDLIFESLKLRCNVINLDPNPDAGKVSKEEVMRMGFDGFLVDFVDGPPEHAETKVRQEDQRLRKIKDDLMEQKKELLSRKTAYERLINSLVRIDSSVDANKRFIKEEEGRVRALVKSKGDILKRRVKLVKDFMAAQKVAVMEFGEMTVSFMEAVHYEDAFRRAEKALANAMARNEEILNIHRILVTRFEEVKTRAKKLLETAREKINGRSQEDRDEMNQMREGKTVEQLQDAHTSAKVRAELLGEHDGDLLREYQEKSQELERWKVKVAQKRESSQTLGGDIEKIKGDWLPVLKELIGKISDAFSASFDAIGCAGEVKLKQEEDFDKWGINIFVKFRESEKLQALTAHRQSGGSPFRVVDEINQGMDPRNERMVHSQMVEVACQEGNSQYFLITPKLLPDLDYHERMKVLVIYNGDYQPEKLDIGKYVRAKRGLA